MAQALVPQPQPVGADTYTQPAGLIRTHLPVFRPRLEGQSILGESNPFLPASFKHLGRRGDATYAFKEVYRRALAQVRDGL